MANAYTPAGTSIFKRCFGFWETLCRIWIIIWNKRKTGDRCNYLPARIITRPDPCIYSQFMLMQLHLPVTWANPDVTIFLGGVPQDTFHLIADTLYDVQITVHNSSHDQPADNTQVSVGWIEFGAGGQILHPITKLVTNIPVWPGVSVLHVPWRTPPTPGHFCIDIRLYHPRDANPANNHGWNNTQVYAAHSPAVTSMRVFNRWVAGAPIPPKQALAAQSGARAGVPWNLVEVTVDSYIFHDAYGREAHPDQMFAPRPPAWPVKIDPATFHFEPHETYRDVAITIDAPSGAGPSENFNISAHQGGAPLGGITVLVTRS
jgi:hypothetical protein